MKRLLALPVLAAVIPVFVHAGTGGTVNPTIPGAFPAGKSVVIRFSAAIDNPVAAGVDFISTQGTVSGTGFAPFSTGDPDEVGPGDPVDATVTPLTAAPDMALSKSDAGASNIPPGQTVSYTLTYNNIGNQGATGVVLTETVPATTTFNAGASTGTWVCTPDINAFSTCTQVVGGVNGGGSGGSVVFAVTFAPLCPPSTAAISNTASVADDGLNGPDLTPNNTANDTTSVNVGDTTTVVGSDRNPSDLGDNVMLTATVTSVVPGCVPTGSATINDNVTPLGSGALDGLGEFSLTTSSLTAGTHPITGDYAGNPPFNPSTSSVLNQVVVAATTVAPGDVKISEFRFRGPAGAEDEYVELVNATGAAITVKADGWALSKWNGGPPVTIGLVPGATVIPPKGHVLFVNNTLGTGFSVGGYAAASGATVGLGDVQYAGNIPDDDGIALFKHSTTLDLANQLDAAGFTGADALYREGAGLSPIGSTGGEYAFMRQSPGGVIKDTGDNAADFLFVSTDAGVYNGVQAALGAPGPEKLTSPIDASSGFTVALLDPGRTALQTPNRGRTGAGNSGTIQFRRRITNNTGAPVTRLRFRVVDVTTKFGPGYSTPTQADIRPASGLDFMQPLSDGLTVLPVEGLTREEPPDQTTTLLGGGFNTTLANQDVALASPLAIGATINVNFLFNVHRIGNYRAFITIEAVP